jgi:hypothetical protein
VPSYDAGPVDEPQPGLGAWPQHGLGPREQLRAGLVWPLRRDPDGINGPTPAMLRGTRFRRTSHGLYVPAHVPRSVEQRIVEAYAVHRAGVVTGWAALRWCGGRWFDEGVERPVPIVLEDEGRSRQPRLVEVSQEFLNPADVRRTDGVRTTSAVRSVAYEMRRAPYPLRAAQCFAMAAYDDLVSIDELARYCEDDLPRWTGVQMVRDVLPYLTENAWSPTEVTMGWVWRLHRPAARLAFNTPVFSLDGRHLGTPDVLDLDVGVRGEYQGALHLAGERRAKDVVRDEVLLGAGLEMAVMLASDLRDPRQFLGRLDGAYERAAARTRKWTVEQPASWIDTTTVARRRALRGRDRERLLRYRTAA